MHFIEREVTNLRSKYKTEDPFEICRKKHINYLLVDMHPEINGIYQYVKKNKFIYINSKLPEKQQLYTCYHELGHSIMHEKINCTFLRTCTYLNMNKLEKEAELFTAYFLIPDVSKLFKFKDLTLDEISYKLNVPKEYIIFRLEYNQNHKYSID